MPKAAAAPRALDPAGRPVLSLKQGVARMVWQERDAAERFEEFYNAAVNEGPQTLARGGVEAAVFISVKEWAALKAKSEKMEAKTDPQERR
jgi:hypothetical protein